MAPSPNRERILTVLYDLALVFGSQLQLAPLLTHSLQRLLHHTSFPAGLVLLHHEDQAPEMVTVECVIGDTRLARALGNQVAVPADWVNAPIHLDEAVPLRAWLPPFSERLQVSLHLPMPGLGLIILLAPQRPDSELPLESIFQPVMANLAKAIVLCRNNDTYTRSLHHALHERDRRLQRVVHFDTLTELPNRLLLTDRLQQAIAQAQHNHAMLAVCYLDLDHFKPINDRYGHQIGDRLLVEMAHRLREVLRGGDTLARPGGDEFVILLTGLHEVADCQLLLQAICEAIARPWQPTAQQELRLTASIGITLYPADNGTPDSLLRHADQAMYTAKQSGPGSYHFFDPDQDRQARAHREALERIQQGHQAGEFCLFYQPKVNMRTGQVIGAEALIRWQHPELGLLSPAAFLPVVDDSPFAVELGEWVIERALCQLECWHAQGLPLTVSVNIAARHLQVPDFVQRLRRQLAIHPHVPPAALELEILESAALDDVAYISMLMKECCACGVSFSLDDFGTGYSSLTYLKRLPAAVLKIDQSFVRDMLADPEDLAIVDGVIGLAQAFQRTPIAEGVETAQHGVELLRLGCELAQGYGIARPMPAAELPDWIARYQPPLEWR